MIYQKKKKSISIKNKLFKIRNTNYFIIQLFKRIIYNNTLLHKGFRPYNISDISIQIIGHCSKQIRYSNI